MMKMSKMFGLLLLMGVLATMPDVAQAEDFLTEAEEVQSKAEPVDEQYVEADGWEKPIPFSFGIDYTLVSDYIFRGINFSEYAGEGREKPNHQLSVGGEVDLGEYGAVGGSVWFEWFAGQESLTPNDSSNLQEVDYSAYWAYDFEQIYTSVELGWIYYSFPRLSGDADATQEWYVSLSFDDSFLFGTEESVLNPFFTLYHDFDDFGGYWMEAGVSHDFAMADMGMEDVMILKDVTVTPSLTLGIDHRWVDEALASGSPSTRLANLTYGMDVFYDLGSALEMPEQYGSIGINGFLYYSQAFRDDVLNDEFYGGVTLSYGW